MSRTRGRPTTGCTWTDHSGPFVDRLPQGVAVDGIRLRRLRDRSPPGVRVGRPAAPTGSAWDDAQSVARPGRCDDRRQPGRARRRARDPGRRPERRHRHCSSRTAAGAGVATHRWSHARHAQPCHRGRRRPGRDRRRRTGPAAWVSVGRGRVGGRCRCRPRRSPAARATTPQRCRGRRRTCLPGRSDRRGGGAIGRSGRCGRGPATLLSPDRRLATSTGDARPSQVAETARPAARRADRAATAGRVTRRWAARRRGAQATRARPRRRPRPPRLIDRDAPALQPAGRSAASSGRARAASPRARSG